jgi:membrane-bound lytic murein transglycosylase A
MALLLSACASTCPVCPTAPEPAVKSSPWSAAQFGDLPGWQEDDLAAAWPAYRASCGVLCNKHEAWREVCAQAAQIDANDTVAMRRHFETLFRPYRMTQPDGGSTGLVTGYYEPLLRGSRNRQGAFVYPLYAAPDDLLTIDLGAVAPETKNIRLRGRVEGRKIIPYYSRAEIESGTAPLAGKELVFVDDVIEAFFLQIQGSGRVQLEDGTMLRVGYADQNGHPYQSIGRYLLDKGELQPGQASMQNIQAWARANPARLQELLNHNASYVFFRELREQQGGPIGALGIAIEPERSIAVDPRYVTLGAPVWLTTTRPNSSTPMRRLMLAQDTGGAIRGPVRADFFWGFGQAAGEEAGRMRQNGEMWVLLPLNYPLPPQPK